MAGFQSPLLGLHPFNFHNPGLRVACPGLLSERRSAARFRFFHTFSGSGQGRLVTSPLSACLRARLRSLASTDFRSSPPSTGHQRRTKNARTNFARNVSVLVQFPVEDQVCARKLRLRKKVRIWVDRLLILRYSLVPKGGLEPPRVSPPPPQDGVSASSTTSALELKMSGNPHWEKENHFEATTFSPGQAPAPAQAAWLASASAWPQPLPVSV